jgi:formate-dependent nitrite reductase membrane component NrfD
LFYSFLIWIILKLGFREIKFKNIRNALILGSFPQILHLLFVIWDYPRNEQFNYLINLATFTSHLSALSAIQPLSKVPLLSILIGHFLAVQVKRLSLL